MPRQAIGIDIGGTLTKIAIVLDNGEIRQIEKLRTAAHTDTKEYLGRLIQSIEKLVDQTMIAGIGIAVPGFLSENRHSIRYNPNTPALVGLDFINLLNHFHLPVWLEQDLNVPTMAEYHFGQFRGAPRLMTASIGTGLGAGFMIEGRVLDFAGSTIGDTGHIILQPDGPTCTAGCHGCAEALIATPNIERLAETYGRSHIRAEKVISAAKDGEQWATEIMDQIGDWLGQWLASLSPIFLPSHIVLCGGVTETGELLLKRTETRFRELSGPEYTQCVIAISRFGGHAGVIGAAAPFLTNSVLEK